MKHQQRTQHDLTRLNAIVLGCLVGLFAGIVVSTFRLIIEHLLSLVQASLWLVGSASVVTSSLGDSIGVNGTYDWSLGQTNTDD